MENTGILVLCGFDTAQFACVCVLRLVLGAVPLGLAFGYCFHVLYEKLLLVLSLWSVFV